MTISSIIFFLITFLIGQRSEIKNNDINDDLDYEGRNSLIISVISVIKVIGNFISKNCDKIIIILFTYIVIVFFIDLMIYQNKYSVIHIFTRLTFTPSLNFNSTGQVAGEYYCNRTKWAIFDFPNRDYFYINHIIPETDRQEFYSIIGNCK